MLCLAMIAASPASAEPRAQAAPSFDRMWTGWSSVNREALVHEDEAVRRYREDLATADAQRLRALSDQGRLLGERVGEIVRLGDCEEGERVARAAGDFALVEAVRGYCRAEPQD